MHEYLTRVGLIKAVENFHGGGFSSAVFADDAMDCSGLDPEVQAGIGGDVAEAFGYAAELDGWGRIRRIQSRMNTQRGRGGQS